jgi:hypothetical protein
MSAESPFHNLVRTRLVHPPDAIAAFIRLLGHRNYHGEEKRSKPRIQVTVPLIVLPLNEATEPIGEPFRALSRDISTDGIGFLHTRRIEARLAAIEIENPQAASDSKMQVLVEICRCHPIHSTLYEIGGKFVMRLDSDAAPETEPSP